MFLLITITNAISQNGNRDWIMWGGSLGDQSDSSDFPSATCHWHRNIFLINLSCHGCVWTKGPGPHLYGFVTKSCPLPCIVGFLSWAPGPATWDTTLTFSDNFSVRLSPWVAGSSLCFKSSVPDAGMVKERALCPISPSAHDDSFPCHIFLHSPCFPQSIPNPVWPVLPQIPLQLFLTSSEAGVTGVSISRGKYELSPLPWRETMDSSEGHPPHTRAMEDAMWLLSAMTCRDILSRGRLFVSWSRQLSALSLPAVCSFLFFPS